MASREARGAALSKAGARSSHAPYEQGRDGPHSPMFRALVAAWQEGQNATPRKSNPRVTSPHSTGSSLSLQSVVLPLEGCCQGPQQDKHQAPGKAGTKALLPLLPYILFLSVRVATYRALNYSYFICRDFQPVEVLITANFL